MLILHCSYSLLVLLLCLQQVVIPLLIELLVLHYMCLFHLFTLPSLVVDELLSPSLEILLSQLVYSILSHFSLHILPLLFTLPLMLF